MTEYARLVPTDMLGPYLVGRQLLARDPARALPHLARACDSGPTTLAPEFLRECRRMLVDAAYRIGDFPRARTALERLAADANGEADRLRALDMRARIDWAAEPPLRPGRGRHPLSDRRDREHGPRSGDGGSHHWTPSVCVRQWPRWRPCDVPPCSGC